ncbi:hypothetical protein MXB_5467 [Myxobolus squamalis]|nr:hypothetical protein MXB_5467 [Myxobolus squamalis]
MTSLLQTESLREKLRSYHVCSGYINDHMCSDHGTCVVSMLVLIVRGMELKVGMGFVNVIQAILAPIVGSVLKEVF